jgi:hypothetical protein
MRCDDAILAIDLACANQALAERRLPNPLVVRKKSPGRPFTVAAEYGGRAEGVGSRAGRDNDWRANIATGITLCFDLARDPASWSAPAGLRGRRQARGADARRRKARLPRPKPALCPTEPGARRLTQAWRLRPPDRHDRLRRGGKTRGGIGNPPIPIGWAKRNLTLLNAPGIGRFDPTGASIPVCPVNFDPTREPQSQWMNVP